VRGGGPGPGPAGVAPDDTGPAVSHDDRRLEVRRLGVVPYAEAAVLQQALVEQRRRHEIPDQLLLLEHPHVITLGVRVRADRSHVVAPAEALAAEGIDVVESGRGGDVTYHGPGQLIGYPILQLEEGRHDLHRYVRDIEEALIRALAELDVTGGRIAGLTGVWVGDEKVAAIGVRVSRWITSHGFALNLTTDLTRFGMIVPCGITDRGVTSLERLVGPFDRNVVEALVVQHFADVFGRSL
jgi:lipoyl(octanoyl) transferase